MEYWNTEILGRETDKILMKQAYPSPIIPSFHFPNFPEGGVFD
jgi:hypothetical protein